MDRGEGLQLCGPSHLACFPANVVGVATAGGDTARRLAGPHAWGI